jgi:hypothetical protein
MKKPIAKKTPAKKMEKGKESGELRKPAKLKPLKEKEKKSWKNSLEEEEEDFPIDDENDVKLDSFDDEEDDDFFDENF